MSTPRDPRPRNPRRRGTPDRTVKGTSPRENGGQGRPRGSVDPARTGTAAKGGRPRPRGKAVPSRRPPRGPVPPLRRRFRRSDPGPRIRIALALMGVVLLVFAGRLVQIQGIEAASYASAAAELRLSETEIPTTRGSITDADGRPFAMSVEVRTVFVDPYDVKADERDTIVTELSRRFDLPEEEVARKVDSDDSRYQVIAREVPLEEWKELDELDLQGVAAETAYKRVYPEETGAANLVGFVGTDGHGLEGLESVLEDTLAGDPGSRQVELGTGGTEIPMANGVAKEPVPGHDVRLTLDQDVQWRAQQALAQRAGELGADSGSVIVMRPTGEIVAMANYPTYDPDAIEESTPEQRANGALSAAFEPGSTNKVITAAAALEEDVVTPDTVYTVPDSIRRHGETFRDSHNHPTQRMTLNGIMATSSNVGTIKVAEDVGAEGLYEYLGKFGFGEPSGLGLPGENSGILTAPDEWWGTQLASISFGHGISVNAVQMASVYATVANDGVRVEPTVIAGSTDENGEFRPAPEPAKERVISEETARELRLMLEAVTGEHGTAQDARIPGYRVAGKTGTANRVDPDTGSYDTGGYTSTFVGMAPADDPELIVQVVLHNPKEQYYGGEAAAPVFTDVMSFALKTLQIPPTATEQPNIRLFE
ncbi:peptidoglycan synthetase FtsI [Marinactinospora thermotolerans DSM 45154]|uniref:Peptidoglycan synthetase FtsI n=1 Tax=Marinactinospora thermotolerans DSM 45154 TaxID=1122192 RepID=A0A1T4KW35_9ACTN|nr:penicillin-binding protein 2 [Marinactinospora thermotolerans]SJZ46645.1 peptidoglycan synthetase FtsI [Marinactinospora thermotolerans DSM 45154]